MKWSQVGEKMYIHADARWLVLAFVIGSELGSQYYLIPVTFHQMRHESNRFLAWHRQVEQISYHALSSILQATSHFLAPGNCLPVNEPVIDDVSEEVVSPQEAKVITRRVNEITTQSKKFVQ